MSERECPYCHRIWPDTAEYFRHNYRKCRTCDNAQTRVHRQANREQRLEIQRLAYHANPERGRASSLAYYYAHRERLLEQNRKWRKAHPDNIHEKRRRRRAKIRVTGTDVTAAKIEDLKRRSKGKCYWCGKKAKPIHIDHIKPLSKGGEHSMYNLCVSCATCNCSKKDKTPQEWGVLL